MCTAQSEVTFTESNLTRNVDAGDPGASFPKKQGEPGYPATLVVRSAVFYLPAGPVELAGHFRFGGVSGPETCKASPLTYDGYKFSKLRGTSGDIVVDWVPSSLGSFTVTGRFA